jgi:peroxiredoxin
MVLLCFFLAAGGELGGPASTPSTFRERIPPSATVTAPEPPTTEVRVGDPAPNFSYQAYDGHWRALQDLLGQGAVLLVFAPSDADLRHLQTEREGLLDLGVIPVAVADVRPGRAWSMVRRQNLQYSVIADPRRVIAEQFNAIDPLSHAAVPAWFVIDRQGTVRGLGHQRLPQGDTVALVAEKLGLPLPDLTRPATR